MLRFLINSIITLLSAASITIMVSTPSGATASNGLCIIDINLHLNPNANSYAYDSNRTGNSIFGNKIEVAVDSWDVPLGMETSGATAKTIMSLSYKLGDFKSGKCLDAVALRVGHPGWNLVPITSTSQTWRHFGHWYTHWGRGLKVPANTNLDPNDSKNPGYEEQTYNVISAMFARPMDAERSTWIATELIVQPYAQCETDIGAFCVGSWLDQQGNPRRLIVRMERYEDFLEKSFQAPTGRWVQLDRCTNCAEMNYTTTIGVVSGETIGKTTESSKAFGYSIGIEVEVGAGLVGKKKIMASHSGMFTSSVARSIQNSFERTASAQTAFKCERGVMYQWRMTATSILGQITDANTNIFLCTTSDDKPPRSDYTNFSWGGCEAEQVFSPASIPAGASNNVKYMAATSGYRCAKASSF